MLSTLTSPNSSEVPFPYPPDNDATVLHPRIQVAKHMERLKMSLPSGSKETGLQILQRMAAGDNDNWLNSPIRNEEHLDPPEWIKELLPTPKINEEKRQELNEMMVRSQLEATIAAMKDRQANASNEGSLFSTEYVEALMPLSSSASHAMETSSEAMTQQVNETTNGTIVEAPTTFMPALQTPVSATPVMEKAVPDPVTPIPPVLALKSVPDFNKYQERTSDTLKVKESHYLVKEDENPLDAANASILKHRRRYKEAPAWVTISEKFVDSLRRDVEEAYDIPLPTCIPHVTGTGEVIGIPIMVNDKLRAAPNRIICIS